MRTKVKREITGIDGIFNGTYYGTVGHPTRMTYADGSIAHVGDLVGIYKDDNFSTESLVVKREGCVPFVMGLQIYGDTCVKGVFNSTFTVRLIKKYHEVPDGEYRNQLLKITTLSDDPHLVAPSKKVTEQKKRIFPITVEVKADTVFTRPTVETDDNDGTYIFSGRTTIFVDGYGGYGMATCHPKELKSYSKEVGKALAYYRCYNPKKEK